MISNMDKNILTQLIDGCKVKPLDENVTAKTKTMYECLVCGDKFHNTASSILQRNKKYQSVGCPSCVSANKILKIRSTNRVKLEEKFILPENFEEIAYKDFVFVKNKTCGHEFTTKLDNLLSSDVSCPICEEHRRKSIARWASPDKKKNMPLDKFQNQLNESNKKYSRNIQIKNILDYSGMLTPITFVCDKSHEWKARPANVIHLGSNCPYCAKTNYSRIAIEWLKSISPNIKHAENGGEVKLMGKSGRLYSVDGFDETTNTVYEFNGSAYHGDPNVYEDASTPHPFKKNITAKELRILTTNKAIDLIAAGYNVVSQWESEYKKSSKLLTDFISNIKDLTNVYSFTKTGVSLKINNVKIFYHDVNLCREQLVGKKYLLNFDSNIRTIHIFSDEFAFNKDLVLSKIKYITNSIDVEKIHARKCEIVKLSNRDAIDFFQKNHIQGSDNSQLYYGLQYLGQIVAVMAFTKPRLFMSKNSTNDKRVWELSRFATLAGRSVVGAASKLLKAFEKDNSPKIVFSFADRRWSVGNLYTTLGFIESDKSYQSYFYVINGKRNHRFGYRKSVQEKRLEIFDANLNEYHNMLLNGYDRVWDCGSIKYIKTYR